MKLTWVLCLSLSLLVACSATPEKIKSPARIQAELAHRNALQAIRDGRIESAEFEWRAALQAYQAIDDWQGQGMARLGLAQVQIRQGEKQQAEQVLMPMLTLPAFVLAHQSQAAMQMAQLVQQQDPVRAKEFLRLASDTCASPCPVAAQILNVGAKIALREEHFDSAGAAAQQALSLAAGNIAELAFSQRILAEVALKQREFTVALSWLEQVIVLDRKSAEPLWLLDDYRLMFEIGKQSGDSALQARAEVHLSSLCGALACLP